MLPMSGLLLAARKLLDAGMLLAAGCWDAAGCWGVDGTLYNLRFLTFTFLRRRSPLFPLNLQGSFCESRFSMV